MSGAEVALLGVGILCNVMQILTFAKDFIHVYRNIRDGRAPDPKLDSYRLHVDEPSRRGLRGRVAASKKSALALWRGKELEDAEHNLQRHEQLLHSLLLDQVCTQSQAAEITSLQAFQHLEGTLRDIISQLAHGSTKVSDLVTALSANSSSRVADEHATTRTTIEDQMSSLENTIREDSNIFWVSGKPASGKSSLMKFLASNFSTGTHLRNWRSNVRILTHFFWKPGKLLQRNVEGMVLLLLDQVLDCRPGLCRMLCEAQPYVRHKRSHSDWSLDELTEALIRSLEASPEAFCIFLDGMDEAKELEHLPWPDWTNAQVIHELLKVDNVKLCASSREEHAFCCFFKGAFRIRLHHLNCQDITLFVRNRLVLSGLHCRDRDRLVNEITKKAKGVFLWVSIVFGRLNQALRKAMQLSRHFENASSRLLQIWLRSTRTCGIESGMMAGYPVFERHLIM
ncbi:uncharacterized protein FSUBG_13987 [Fusarium subglutinans]|uniref:Nephrocystin 3-like N-terminal domain-containing protein n=1 Tax=Gibberella subglutinans TaxID=42677 RepID=A0A8H5KMF5_GIBSU|nr:uncharacterized protein FSUBG_13987 [Fusarium subglutinans]KAF5574951.1 hypothetical protein FSUBG_13987 [Fusarium subglutinans]